MEHLVTTGMLDRQNSIGSREKKMTQGMRHWLLHANVAKMLKTAREKKDVWRDMILNTVKHAPT